MAGTDGHSSFLFLSAEGLPNVADCVLISLAQGMYDAESSLGETWGLPRKSVHNLQHTRRCDCSSFAGRVLTFAKHSGRSALPWHRSFSK